MTRPAATSTRGGKRASRNPATGPATTSPAISGAMASIPNTGPKRGTIAKYCGRMSIGADWAMRDHDAGEQGDGHGPPVDLQVRRVGDPTPASHGAVGDQQRDAEADDRPAQGLSRPLPSHRTPDRDGHDRARPQRRPEDVGSLEATRPLEVRDPAANDDQGDHGRDRRDDEPRPLGTGDDRQQDRHDRAGARVDRVGDADAPSRARRRGTRGRPRPARPGPSAPRRPPRSGGPR